MKTCVHLGQYLHEFFLESQIFQTKVVGKIETEFYDFTFAKILPCMG
jgi:hypothetical protein